MNKSQVTLLACGDVGPIHEPIDAYSTLARPVMKFGAGGLPAACIDGRRRRIHRFMNCKET